MILFQIDPVSVSSIELESDAPGSIDVNAVSSGAKASQRMKIEARKVHLLGPDRYVQTIEANQNSTVKVYIHLASAPGPKIGKALVLEAPDHG
jgi:hypothetical protein